MKMLTLFLLLVPALAFAQPDGSGQKPYHMKHAQGAAVIGGQVTCDSDEVLLLNATFQGCKSIVFKNSSSDVAYLCPDQVSCTAGTSFIYLEQHGSFTSDWSSVISGDWRCNSDGTSVVYYYGECG